jgi:hypothetical protein
VKVVLWHIHSAPKCELFYHQMMVCLEGLLVLGAQVVNASSARSLMDTVPSLFVLVYIPTYICVGCCCRIAAASVGALEWGDGFLKMARCSSDLVYSCDPALATRFRRLSLATLSKAL